MCSTQLPRPGHVRARSLHALLREHPNIHYTGASPDVELLGIAQSSNLVQPGDLYVALPGARAHGADYAAHSVAAGARAILTDEVGAARIDAAVPVLVTPEPRQLAGPVASWIYGNPSHAVKVVGITGTNGKTTVAYLLNAALAAAGHTTGLIGTVETRIAAHTIESSRTTPEAAELQGLLAYALEQGVDTVVMEASSHGFALGRLSGVRFATGVFTNLSVDHLDLHHTMEEYFAAKAMLFDGRASQEIVNVDDEYGRRLLKDDTVTFGLRGHGQWRASGANWNDTRQEFLLHTPEGQTIAAAVGLPGLFNVANAIAAIAAAHSVGVPVRVAVQAIADSSGVPGRMERVSSLDASILGIVDYAHAPDGVQKALSALRPVTKGRLICVLGCGGDRDVSKRPLMGAAAVRGSDIFIATDDNPRSEPPAAIREAMLKGAWQIPESERAQVLEVDGRLAAIERAVQLARTGDTIAVLGKGHELGQEIAGVKHPFDDRKALTQALKGAHE
ncbi:MAG: UDP-N-acetylmuramoyl-L-alanyl-D-glutamate--2,6-diaminopimelate ligase [Corynebacteriales bacterium]|nr:UDP-N-acetylmuramoyl-L-alanyl-D-glutamate--2,6-diaminopimelate ligase [Mycobacteriales bacterium]